MRGSEIFVPKIPSYHLMDLVYAFSNNPKINLIEYDLVKKFMRK